MVWGLGFGAWGLGLGAWDRESSGYEEGKGLELLLDLEDLEDLEN